MSLNLLMFSGDRDVAAGRQGPFHATLSGLIREFDRIDVLTPRVPGAVPHVIHEAVHVHPSPAARWSQARWLRKKAGQLARERAYALLVSHDYGIFANGRAAARVSRRLGIPYVSEIHHIPAHPKPAQWWEPLAKRAYRAYARYAARRARAIRVVNHREVPDQLVRWGVPRDAILVLPSAAIDREVFAPGDRTKRYLLGFVGRLVANKGLAYLAEIFIAVAAGRPDARFVVAGSGPEERRLRRSLHAAGVIDRVDWVPWLDRPEELADLYRGLHALVCTSLSEGGPRVCLESMACGTPVFATPVGLMPEIIPSAAGGWLLPWDHAAGAALVAERLRDPAGLAAAGLAARAATEPFERGTVLGAYAAAYRRLAEESRA